MLRSEIRDDEAIVKDSTLDGGISPLASFPTSER